MTPLATMLDPDAYTGPTGPAEVPDIRDILSGICVRLADEGVPIAAIARSLKIPAASFRPVLQEAVLQGVLINTPREDWSTRARESREPEMKLQSVHTQPDDLLYIAMNKAFGCTQLESKVLLHMIRKGQSTREGIKDAVEATRGGKEPAEYSMLNVILYRVRKKLEPFGMSIQTVHAQGYLMSNADRDTAQRMIQNAIG